MLIDPTPAAILFDVDGTLLDSYHLYLEAYRRALQPVLGRVPALSEFVARQPSSERHFLSEWVGAEHVAAVHQAMCRHYAELHDEYCEGLYEGIAEMLSSLRSAGIRMGVVTGKGRTAWEITSAALDLGSFEVIITEDDVARPKPDPAGLLMAAEALGLPPHRIVYVGDSLGDLGAARAAEMPAGAALWPKTAPGERSDFVREAVRHMPRWLFESPLEIAKLLFRGAGERAWPTEREPRE